MFDILKKLNPFRIKKDIVPEITIDMTRYIEEHLNSIHLVVPNIDLTAIETSQISIGPIVHLPLQVNLNLDTSESIRRRTLIENSFQSRASAESRWGEEISHIFSSHIQANFFVNRQEFSTGNHFKESRVIPDEITQYTKKQDNPIWNDISHIIQSRLSPEEQTNFHCPITQDIITSPPLLIIGVNGTPIHFFDGRALLEAFKHKGLINPITREKINLTQIKHGDEAIDYIKAMIAEYVHIYSLHALVRQY